MKQPSFPTDETASLTKTFGLDPAERRFRALLFPSSGISSSPPPEEEEGTEENMSSGSAKPPLTLDMILAARQKKSTAGRRTSKRRADSALAGPSSSRRRHASSPSPDITPVRSDPPIVDLSEPLPDLGPRPAGSAPAEVTLRFPEGFGRPKCPGDLVLMDHMLLPGPRSLLENKALGSWPTTPRNMSLSRCSQFFSCVAVFLSWRTMSITSRLKKGSCGFR